MCKTIRAAMSNFSWEYIMSRCEIPYKIVSDKGTTFVNKQVEATLKGYDVKKNGPQVYRG